MPCYVSQYNCYYCVESYCVLVALSFPTRPNYLGFDSSKDWWQNCAGPLTDNLVTLPLWQATWGLTIMTVVIPNGHHYQLTTWGRQGLPDVQSHSLHGLQNQLQTLPPAGTSVASTRLHRRWPSLSSSSTGTASLSSDCCSRKHHQNWHHTANRETYEGSASMGEWFLTYQRYSTKHSQCRILEDQNPLLHCRENFKPCKLKYTHTQSGCNPWQPIKVFHHGF